MELENFCRAVLCLLAKLSRPPLTLPLSSTSAPRVCLLKVCLPCLPIPLRAAVKELGPSPLQRIFGFCELGLEHLPVPSFALSQIFQVGPANNISSASHLLHTSAAAAFGVDIFAVSITLSDRACPGHLPPDVFCDALPLQPSQSQRCYRDGRALHWGESHQTSGRLRKPLQDAVLGYFDAPHPLRPPLYPSPRFLRDGHGPNRQRGVEQHHRHRRCTL